MTQTEAINGTCWRVYLFVLLACLSGSMLADQQKVESYPKSVAIDQMLKGILNIR